MMNRASHVFARVGRKDGSWICSFCARIATQQTSKQAVRRISSSSKPRQNVAPTMEQLREPFKKGNTSILYVIIYVCSLHDWQAQSYYTVSIILGTVAFSYGSVPMYKMVSPPCNGENLRLNLYRSAKLPAGEANPSNPRLTVTRANPPPGSNPSPTTNGSASPSTAPYRTFYLGNLLPNNAKFEFYPAKLLWHFIRRRTNRQKILLGSLPIASPLGRWPPILARSNAFALRSRG